MIKKLILTGLMFALFAGCSSTKPLMVEKVSNFTYKTRYMVLEDDTADVNKELTENIKNRIAVNSKFSFKEKNPPDYIVSYIAIDTADTLSNGLVRVDYRSYRDKDDKCVIHQDIPVSIEQDSINRSYKVTFLNFKAPDELLIDCIDDSKEHKEITININDVDLDSNVTEQLGQNVFSYFQLVDIMSDIDNIDDYYSPTRERHLYR